uniref:SCP domain-containing protein n=1 Tax=Peronospora matthiolae TaxID=2874970 RepID=A0AAV1TNJ3_9STRA
MLAAVNAQRATQGLAPLCLNEKLHTSAQRHSDDMAAKNFLDHTSSNGMRMVERVTAAKFDWDTVGENIAAGQINVQDVMASWINSSHHLENIMGDYTMFGSAYAFNLHSKEQHRWTQDFGSGEAEACDDFIPDTIPIEHEQEAQGTTGQPTPVTVPNIAAPVPSPVPETPAAEPPAPLITKPVVPGTKPSTLTSGPGIPQTVVNSTPVTPVVESLAPEAPASMTTGQNVPVTDGSTTRIPAPKVPVTEPLPSKSDLIPRLRLTANRTSKCHVAPKVNGERSAKRIQCGCMGT